MFELINLYHCIAHWRLVFCGTKFIIVVLSDRRKQNFTFSWNLWPKVLLHPCIKSIIYRILKYPLTPGRFWTDWYIYMTGMWFTGDLTAYFHITDWPIDMSPFAIILEYILYARKLGWSDLLDDALCFWWSACTWCVYVQFLHHILDLMINVL